MDILVGVVMIVLALLVLCHLAGDDGRRYEEYRRAEYHNEYLWETRERRDPNSCFLDTSALRRP